jgi:hypothetical protein
MVESIREYLSRIGKRGAAATSKKLTPAQKKKRAEKGAAARWAKEREATKALKEGAKQLLETAQRRSRKPAK